MKLSKLHQDQRKRRKKQKKTERELEDERIRQNKSAFQKHVMDQSDVMPDRSWNTDLRQYANLDRAF